HEKLLQGLIGTDGRLTGHPIFFAHYRDLIPSTQGRIASNSFSQLALIENQQPIVLINPEVVMT
ncbi:MAG: hypothetical protein ACI9HY_002258, partial [Planctomycetaceae bacterium]